MVRVEIEPEAEIAPVAGPVAGPAVALGIEAQAPRGLRRFVGRERELAILARAAELAAGGRRQLVVVSGEGGIGKTRLCEQAAEQAEQRGLRVVWGYCWPYGGAPPLWPWSAVLTGIVGDQGARLLADDDGGATVDRERFARFRAVADLLARAIDGTPTMVVIDDLQAADEGTLLLTRFVGRVLGRAPLLVVLARRPGGRPGEAARGVEAGGKAGETVEEPDDSDQARLLADLEGDAVVLPLRRFDLADTAAFLTAHGLGGQNTAGADGAARTEGAVGTEKASDGRRLARTVLRVTGGSPLLLGRAVARDSVRPGLAGVEWMIDGAVAELSAASRHVLGLCAVLGPGAWAGDIAALAGQPVPVALEALAEAQRAGLVEPAGLDRFAFGHDLVRQVAATTLTAAERFDAHAAAAALLGGRRGGEPEPCPEVLLRRAHHALAAAPRSGIDAALAVEAARAAARAARAACDHRQALALVESAVAVADTHPQLAGRAELLAELLVERAEALLALGRLAPARVAFAEAAAQVDGRRTPQLYARVALGSGGRWLNDQRDPLDRRRMLAMTRDALAGLATEEDAVLRSLLAVRLAAEAVHDGGSPDAVQVALTEVRRTGNRRALAQALSLAHHSMLGPEQVHTRLTLAEEMLAVASAAGEETLALVALMWRTVDLHQLGAPQADHAWAQLRKRAEAQGNESVLHIAAAMAVMRLIRAGRLDEAEAAARECRDLGNRVGDLDAVAYYVTQIASLRWLQDRNVELLDLAAAVTTTPDLPAADFAFAAATAAMAARAGRVDDARVALARLVGSGLRNLPSSSTWLAGMSALAEAAALTGDQAVADEAYRMLLPFADLPVMPSLAVACLGSVERALGTVARHRGDPDQAVGHHERALSANLTFGNRPAAAISRADLADALEARANAGDRRRAGDLWAQAHADAVAMGLTVRAERWSARLTVSASGALAVLSHEPGGWTIRADGRSHTLPDLQGLRYLAVLLERPGQDVTVLELRGAALLEAGHQETADRQALDAYRRRLRELDEALADAQTDAESAAAPASALDRIRRLRSERETLRDHLARISGLGGRSRTFASSQERARTAVRKAVTRAIDAIDGGSPGLAAELRTAVTTGLTCRYTPDPDHGRQWTVRH
ncbi:AAA family ATPase [Frankia sp. AgPm24]|nr:AAA family ATPase [Frankia sp. AgPm24]